MKQKDPRLADADSYIFGKIGIDENNPLYNMRLKPFRDEIKNSRLPCVHEKDLLTMKSVRPKNGNKHYFTFSTVNYGCEHTSINDQILKATEIVDEFIQFSRSIVLRNISLSNTKVDSIVNSIKKTFEYVSSYELSDSVCVNICMKNKPPVIIYILDYAGEICINMGGIETIVYMDHVNNDEFIKILKTLISIY